MVYSDNAQTFKRAARHLKPMHELLLKLEIRDFCAPYHVTWKFIVERAPWWGGCWEQLVKSVKVCLRKVLGKSSCSSDQRLPLLTEAEAVINPSPITYYYKYHTEPTVVTPAQLSGAKRLTVLPLRKETTLPFSRVEVL